MKFFVSTTYTIPKKRIIGQPQKWRLIHNLSGHTLGRDYSINAGIDKGNFPVTYPSIRSATHTLFCAAPRGCVVWGRDLKAYYRHLMINPAYWWCMGTELQSKYYFDCYCPFGARSMPAVFQRLSDAIRVIMLRRTSVNALLGMLDDFLGVVYREEDESDENLFRRGRRAAEEFDKELVKMGISKQEKKDSPTAWDIVWLGFHLDTRNQTIAIPEDKQQAVILSLHADFMQNGLWKAVVSTKTLEKMVGTLCHFSQTWPLGKTLLWPLYNALNKYRDYSSEGRATITEAKVELDGDSRESLNEWYMRICVYGLKKKVFCCRGSPKVSIIGVWMERGRALTRRRRKEKNAEAKETDPDGELRRKFLELKLVSQWHVAIGVPAAVAAWAGRRPMTQRVAMAVELLKEFLEAYGGRCGDIIEVRTNLGEFATYISKNCYPKGLDRERYMASIEIHRLLERMEGERELTPRVLKSIFIK